MIENIHSHEGEEENLGKSTFKAPKNIKQIGECTSQKKIYVEDYVFTYIKELVKKEYADCRIAVLLGHYIKTKEERIIMIRGAVEAEGISFDAEDVFNNDTWTEVYENIKKYFSDVEVVGWCIGGPGFILENEEKLKKIHLDNFAGVDKALMKYDSLEGEETFCIYENGGLNKQSGYYIYYEKNDDMQNYMMEHKSVRRESEKEREEKVVREYKEEVKEQTVRENNRNLVHLMYAAGSLMVVLVIVVFSQMINNNHKINALEESVGELNRILNASAKEELDPNAAVETSKKEGGSIEVETISGNLNIKQEEVKGDRANQEAVGKEDSDEQVAKDGDTSEKKDETKKEEQSEKDTSSNKNETSKTDEKTNADVTAKTDEAVESDKKANADEATKTENTTKENENQGQATSSKEDSLPASTDQSGVKYYEVQQGDTLVGISFKLYDSGDYVSKIMELNGITDMDMIYSGEKLIVP